MLTPEQLAMRSTGIGGSEAPALAGVDAYGNTLLSLYARKVGMVGEARSSEAMNLGSYLESGVLNYYAAREGVKLMAGPMLTHRHPVYGWMFATPDALVVDEAGATLRSVQVKCLPGHRRYDVSDPRRLAPHLRVQVEWEMEVLGLTSCDLVVLLGGNELIVHRLERDPELAAALVELGRSFWHEHVEARVPPPIDGSKLATELQARFFPPLPETQWTLRSPEGASDPEPRAQRIEELAERVEALGAERAAIELELRQCKQALALEIGTYAKVRTDRWRISRFVVAGSVDWRAAAEAAGVTEQAAEAFRGRGYVDLRVYPVAPKEKHPTSPELAARAAGAYAAEDAGPLVSLAP